MYGLTLSWGQPEVPEMLETSHRSLDSRMQLQGDQIHDIEQELVMVPPDHTNGQVINSKLTQLQVRFYHHRFVRIYSCKTGLKTCNLRHTLQVRLYCRSQSFLICRVFPLWSDCYHTWSSHFTFR